MKPVPFRLSDATRGTLFKLFLAALAVALVAMIVDVAAILRTDPDSPTGGDGPYYIGLAKSMAEGRGYYLEESFWPDRPNVARSPLWPAMLSIPVRIFPNANGFAILRFTGTVVHGLCAALLVPLAFQLTGSIAGGALAGAMLAAYPVAAGLVMGGYSEPAYLLVALAGLVLILEGGKWLYAGALLCGTGVLARSNFVLTPFMLVIVVGFCRPRLLMDGRNVRRLAVATALFCVFPAVWILRNYLVSGYFPVLSAMEGETLYGGNNARVASDLSVWGYWVMPNDIPGELTKKELAQTRTELELNKYYHDKAMEFIQQNSSAMPRLIVGKLVRGFVPVPWVPLAASYLAFFFRACLYVAFVGALVVWRDRWEGYSLLLGAMFLVTLLTTVIYYGTFRFTFCLEPFLMPVVVGGVMALIRARLHKSSGSEMAVHSV